jgi:DNA-binding GntR family transcriptional regulator
VQTESAQAHLRRLILDGTYAAGTRLTEVDAATTLAMSRTPVREALRALAADGLVRPAGRGVVVVVLGTKDLDDAYAVRAALEALTAERAAARQADGRIAPADLASLREVATRAAEATAAGDLGTAVHHNRAFHRQIAVLADNALALQTLDRIWDQIQVSTRQTLTPPARPAEVSAQHEGLLAAIIGGRGAQAGRIARRHVLDTRAGVHKGG